MEIFFLIIGIALLGSGIFIFFNVFIQRPKHKQISPPLPEPDITVTKVILEEAGVEPEKTIEQNFQDLNSIVSIAPHYFVKYTTLTRDLRSMSQIGEFRAKEIIRILQAHDSKSARRKAIQKELSFGHQVVKILEENNFKYI